MSPADGSDAHRARVRVAHAESFAPLAWRAGQRSRGLLIELAGAALRRAGRWPRYVPLAHAELLPALWAGRVDCVAALGVVPDRQERLRFSRPLLISGGAWFMTRASRWGPLAGGVIATPVSGPLAGIVRGRFPALRVLAVADYRAAFEAVLCGTAHAAALNFHAGRHQARKDFPGCFSIPEHPFAPVPMSIAFRPGACAALVDRVDDAIAKCAGARVGATVRRS